ncbi:hypothetical protein Pmani_007434 [Petrolisthes manimaculis]|uniref:Uncharacterized protein n=1 Tax=Petrolisthes manimaculis TaxID=1843537 RepID=A0AAE1QAY1_9EUCA|nr:hypothetical protein Pmani_007434 [Petrolisthes manimaculis]
MCGFRGAVCWLGETFSGLVIRWRSGCVVVVTSSSDTNFLASLAEESRSGDLLVWPSRMVVATHLTQPIVLNLMQQHWTLSMTNAVLLNQEDHFNNSMWVAYQYRPHHSLPKHQVVRAAYWIPEEGIVTTTSYQLNKEFVKFRDGVSLIVTATHWPPHVYLFGNTEEVEDERREADSLNFQGPMANILTIIAQKLNFTYETLASCIKLWLHV